MNKTKIYAPSLLEQIEVILKLIQNLQLMAGLAESDRLGLCICSEILEEIINLPLMSGHLSAMQATHLEAPFSEFIKVAKALPLNPNPQEISLWRQNLYTVAKNLAYSTKELHYW